LCMNRAPDRGTGEGAMTKVLEASRRRLTGGASIPILAEAAEAQYWEGLADDEFDRYERRQRFVDHFAVSLTHRQAEVLGVVAEECQDHGHCALSISEIADEAFVSHGTVYNALRVALELGLIEMREENVIRIIAPEWQAVLREQEGRVRDDPAAGRARSAQEAKRGVE
jgi:predicted DNA-binding protein YlxM (UPF0122 family)